MPRGRSWSAAARGACMGAAERRRARAPLLLTHTCAATTRAEAAPSISARCARPAAAAAPAAVVRLTHAGCRCCAAVTMPCTCSRSKTCAAPTCRTSGSGSCRGGARRYRALAMRCEHEVTSASKCVLCTSCRVFLGKNKLMQVALGQSESVGRRRRRRRRRRRPGGDCSLVSRARLRGRFCRRATRTKRI